jgi:hypothetical protein
MKGSPVRVRASASISEAVGRHCEVRGDRRVRTIFKREADAPYHGRMPVGRLFQKDDLDLSAVAFPDWDVLAQVGDLFAQYALPGHPVEFRGHDRRGIFLADDLDAFRAEADERGAQLETIIVETTGEVPDGEIRRLYVSQSAHGLPSAQIWSTDEILVNGIGQRLQDLYAAASSRRTRDRAERGSEREPAGPVPASGSTSAPASWHPWRVIDPILRHPIISGLVVAGILVLLGAVAKAL